MRTLLFTLLCAWPLFASDLASEYFEKGNRFYEKGDYDSALIVYGKILSMGLHDGRVYYNMGNAFYRKKELGSAILHYELARRLDASDDDINANLRFAYAGTADKIVRTRGAFLYRAALKLHHLLGMRDKALAFLVLLYLTGVLFIFFLFCHPRFRSRAVPALTLLLVLMVPLSLSFFIGMRAESTRLEAVVLSPKIDVRNEPDGAQSLFSVHEGAKFSLIRRVGEWRLGSLENGLTGWVHEKDLGLIEFPD